MADEVRREWFEKDFYGVLGVPKNASAAEIRKAYRKLAQQHHPDAKQGDPQAEERFKEITAAYDVLGDAEKRKAYDRVREMGASGVGPGFGGAGWPGGASGGWPGGVRYEQVDVDDISDLFGGLFGGAGRRGGRRGGVRRGADLETQVTVDFEQAMIGTTVPVRIDGPAVCSRCGGSGAEPGTTPVTCPQCGGRGEIAENQGFFSLSRPCPRCAGAGRIVETPCRSCGGSGAERRTRTLNVKIPTGVRDGARIRITGKGEPGLGGEPAGDLYVKVAVRPHGIFGRHGDDLTVDLPITYAEAALGANVQVPTMNGPVTLKIPAGTPTGKTFRVKGRGAPRGRGGRGDLLAKVHVDVPKKLSREEKELVRQLREVQEASPRARLGMDGGGDR
jgi:molecular chaperone DnaJ